MLIFSLKISKKKIFVFLILISIILVISIKLLLKGFLLSQTCIEPECSCKVENKDNMVEFLNRFGWEVTKDPIEISDIMIPEVFNDTYENYNKIQKEQGLDLKKYQGKEGKRYSFEVVNYENKLNGVRANLIVLENQIIGADISNVELDGFMHGLEKNQ